MENSDLKAAKQLRPHHKRRHSHHDFPEYQHQNEDWGIAPHNTATYPESSSMQKMTFSRINREMPWIKFIPILNITYELLFMAKVPETFSVVQDFMNTLGIVNALNLGLVLSFLSSIDESSIDPSTENQDERIMAFLHYTHWAWILNLACFASVFLTYVFTLNIDFGSHPLYLAYWWRFGSILVISQFALTFVGIVYTGTSYFVFMMLEWPDYFSDGDSKLFEYRIGFWGPMAITILLISSASMYCAHKTSKSLKRSQEIEKN